MAYRPASWSHLVVVQCWQQWITKGTVNLCGRSGEPKKRNENEENKIIRETTLAQKTSLASIRCQFLPSKHLVVSRKTIRRRLALRKMPLIQIINNVDRIFCQTRAFWNLAHWRHVIFSDNLDSVSVLITTAHACGGFQNRDPIRYLFSNGIQ